MPDWVVQAKAANIRQALAEFRVCRSVREDESGATGWR